MVRGSYTFDLPQHPQNKLFEFVASLFESNSEVEEDDDDNEELFFLQHKVVNKFKILLQKLFLLD
jgi:hypothetical protein